MTPPSNGHRCRGLPRPLFSLALACTLLVPARWAVAADLRFLGEITGEDGTSPDDQALGQRYDLDFSHQAALSALMQLQGSVRYSHVTDDGVQRDEITPSIRLGGSNQLFTTNLSAIASRSRQEQGNDNDTSSWEAGISSNWQDTFLPSLRFYAGQSFAQSDGEANRSDSESRHAGVSGDWQTLVGAWQFTYQDRKNEDKVSGRRDDSRAFTGRFQTSRSFFADRLDLSFAQQYSHTTTTSEAPVTSGGSALLPVAVTGLAAADDPTPENGALSQVAGLTDNDRTNGVFTINPLPQQANLGVRADFRPLDVLMVHTQDDISAVAGQFAFDLYTSSDNTTWTRVATNLAPSYDANRKELQVATGRREARFLKLVVTAAPATPVVITECTAWRQVAASGPVASLATDSEAMTTDIGVGVHLHPDLTLRYAFTYQKNRFTDTPDYESKTLTATLDWRLSPRTDLNLAGRATIQGRDGESETLTRSWSATASHRPLDTLDLMAGLTLNQSYQGETKQSESLVYQANIGAALYRDLDGRLDYSRTETKTMATGDRSTVDTLDGRLTARLFPSLVADLHYTMQRSTAAGTSLHTDTLNTSANWRPSSYFGLRADWGWRWAAGETSTAGLTMDLAPTANTQLNLAWRRSRAVATSQSYALSWRWNLDQHLTFSTDWDYQDGETEDTWRILARLRATYQVF